MHANGIAARHASNFSGNERRYKPDHRSDLIAAGRRFASIAGSARRFPFTFSTPRDTPHMHQFQASGESLERALFYVGAHDQAKHLSNIDGGHLYGARIISLHVARPYQHRYRQSRATSNGALARCRSDVSCLRRRLAPIGPLLWFLTIGMAISAFRNIIDLSIGRI